MQMMTRSMRPLAGVGLIAAAALGLGWLAGVRGAAGMADPPQGPDRGGVLFFDHDRVKSGFAKGGVLFKRDNYQVHTSYREQGGKPEAHASDTDIFYIIEGRGRLVTGGKLEGGKETAPGETLGERIEGGEDRPVQAGDIIVIPRTIPHWFKEASNPFRYLTMKVRER